MPRADDPYNEGHPHGLSEREEEIYRLTVVNRLTQREIGERMGIAQPAVSLILKAARGKLPPPDLGKIRDEALALHMRTQRMALELAEMNGAPVTAGKDGDIVRDPENNAVVRDYAGRVAALKLALEADREIRKLMGADAATKTEVSGGVRHEVVGIDPKDLI